MNVYKIFGPPGTGKTHRLLSILERVLAEGVPSNRIAFLTFSRAARQEAMDRAMTTLNLTVEDLPWFRTFHSVAYRALAMNASTLITRKEDLQEFADLVGYEFDLQVGNEGEIRYGQAVGDRLMAFEHFRRHRCWDLQTAFERWHEPLRWHDVEYFSRTYEQWKSVEGLFDFTDLLERVDETIPVDVVFVDEAQDLSTLQWRTLDRLARDASRIYLAGDDDQAIFEWAGADPVAFLNRPGAVDVLSQSYRVPLAVHKLAQRLALDIEGPRQEKEWFARAVPGAVTTHVAVDQVELPEGSVRIMARNAYLLEDMVERLRWEGTPYLNHDRLAAGLELGHVILTWERLLRGKAQPVKMVRSVVREMRPGIHVQEDALRQLRNWEGEVTLAMLQDGVGLRTTSPWYEALDRLPSENVMYLRRALRAHGTKALTETPRVHLSTIHQAKGTEADHVVLLTDASTKVQETMLTNPDTERRVFYVGITRARETLALVGVDNPLL